MEDPEWQRTYLRLSNEQRNHVRAVRVTNARDPGLEVLLYDYLNEPRTPTKSDYCKLAVRWTIVLSAHSICARARMNWDEDWLDKPHLSMSVISQERARLVASTMKFAIEARWTDRFVRRCFVEAIAVPISARGDGREKPNRAADYDEVSYSLIYQRVCLIDVSLQGTVSRYRSVCGTFVAETCLCSDRRRRQIQWIHGRWTIKSEFSPGKEYRGRYIADLSIHEHLRSQRIDLKASGGHDATHADPTRAY